MTGLFPLLEKVYFLFATLLPTIPNSTRIDFPPHIILLCRCYLSFLFLSLHTTLYLNVSDNKWWLMRWHLLFDFFSRWQINFGYWWLFTLKISFDDKIDCYKTHLVTEANTHIHDIEIFSSIVKTTPIFSSLLNCNYSLLDFVSFQH